MPGRAHTVAFGAPATALLGRLVAAARGDDPLAGVTVVVPSAVAGTTLRRRLAADAGGLVGVDVVTFPQLAARLAAPRLDADGRPPLPPMLGRAHLRATLARLGDRLGLDPAILHSPATEDAFDRTIRELAPLDDAELDALARRGGTTRAAVAVLRAWRAATAAFAAPADLARVAAEWVAGGGAAPPAIVVHLPRRLGPSDRVLLAALAARSDVHVDVVVGRTGDADADRVADDLLAALPGFPVDAAGPPPEPPRPAELIRVPDPAEEAAMAVRRVVAALTGPNPLRAERVAIVSRTRDPYAAAVADELRAAEIEHHAPAVGTLAQTAPGRTLVALLEVIEGGFRRTDVSALLRAAPLKRPSTGAPVRAARWDRLAREAGVIRGVDQWRDRLAAARAAAAEWLDDDHPRLRDLVELAEFVDELHGWLTPPGAPSWRAWSRWLRERLAGLLRPQVDQEEGEELDAVLGAVDGLAALDGVDAPPDLARVRRALEPALARPGAGRGRFGQGVLVGSLVDAVGADLDLVVVLGAADGRFPPRRRDDPLVPDRDRAAAGGALPPRGLRRQEEHRDLLAALAAAPHAILVAPRSDPREQRERQPAPWFLEACSALAGSIVGSDQLDSLRGAGWFTDVPSFEAWSAGAGPPTSPHELDRADLLADHRAGRKLSAGVVAAGDRDLARGLTAAEARRAGAFGEWAGHLGLRPALLAGFDRPRSPTGLERYAQCPFRFFLADVLDVGAVEDPTALDLISPIDEGVLVHEVLERFVAGADPKQPDEPWTDEERARLLELADEVARRFEDEGRTGRPLLWGVRKEQLRHQLLRILDHDEALRAELGVAPVAVELRFGFDEEEPVELDLGRGRRLAFHGVIDRVDRSPDGRRLVVYDYKTGKPDPFRAVAYDGTEGDLTARGTKLQLPIYALAARARYPEAEEVEARYWFVGRKGEGRTYGGPFDAGAEARFREVVTTVVDGIEAGVFPANPGADEWRFGQWTHDNCGWCDFDRVCPTSRGEAWVQIRNAPEVAGYLRLAEEQQEDEP